MSQESRRLFAVPLLALGVIAGISAVSLLLREVATWYPDLRPLWIALAVAFVLFSVGGFIVAGWRIVGPREGDY